MPALFCQWPDGSRLQDAPRPRAILPGSFNPLHQGHLALARVAGLLVGGDVHFELSIPNAEKPTLTNDELDCRLQQFIHVAPIWVTHTWSFEDKALLFPQTVFVVGYDTARRIVDPRFYQQDFQRLHQALGKIRKQGCQFLVAGRVDADGEFHVWSHPQIDGEYPGLFRGLSEKDFRLDLSSSQLRAISNGQRRLSSGGTSVA